MPNFNSSKLSELSETSGARKFIFGLQVNIDKSQVSRYSLDGTPLISVLPVYL